MIGRGATIVVAQPAHAKSSIMSLSEIALASATEKRASGGGGGISLFLADFQAKILHRPNRVLMKRSHFLATPRAPRARSGLYSRAQHLAYRLVSSPREEARGPQVLAPPTSACRLLKEESDFRNERDVVPAAIRAGPNRRFIFFVFMEGVSPCETRRRGREFLDF
jgi:hypothetical protein